MNAEQMKQLFRVHRDAKKRRDFDGIMKNARRRPNVLGHRDE